MKKSITSDWSRIAFNGSVKKGKKGGKFISRMTGRDANGHGLVKAGKEPSAPRTINLQKTEESIKMDKNGGFFFQSRKGGKFGKKMEISASLAAKLGV